MRIYTSKDKPPAPRTGPEMTGRGYRPKRTFGRDVYDPRTGKYNAGKLAQLARRKGF